MLAMQTQMYNSSVEFIGHCAMPLTIRSALGKEKRKPDFYGLHLTLITRLGNIKTYILALFY